MYKHRRTNILIINDPEHNVPLYRAQTFCRTKVQYCSFSNTNLLFEKVFVHFVLFICYAPIV